MPTKETQEVVTAKQAEEAHKSMETIAEYLDSLQKEHHKNGKFFKLANKVLVNYRTMKFHQLAFSTNITSDRCINEMADGDKAFEYYLMQEYENLPAKQSQEYPTIASVYDVLDLAGNTFNTKPLESYLSSNRISLEATLSIFCELVLLEIQRRNKTVYEVLYTEFFNLAMENKTLEERIESCDMQRSTYIRNLNKGITMFSNYLFNPYGEVFFCNDNEAHSEIIKLINKAAQIIEKEMKDTNKRRNLPSTLEEDGK